MLLSPVPVSAPALWATCLQCLLAERLGSHHFKRRLGRGTDVALHSLLRTCPPGEQRRTRRPATPWSSWVLSAQPRAGPPCDGPQARPGLSRSPLPLRQGLSLPPTPCGHQRAALWASDDTPRPGGRGPWGPGCFPFFSSPGGSLPPPPSLPSPHPREGAGEDSASSASILGGMREGAAQMISAGQQLHLLFKWRFYPDAKKLL